MIISCVLFICACFILLLGRPVDDVESLYYDVDIPDYTELSKNKKVISDVSTSEDLDNKDIPTSASNGEFNAEAVAKDIYDSIDL